MCYACNAPRAGLTCAQGAPRLGLTCAQGGQRVGLLHRPCQSAAGLYGACIRATTPNPPFQTPWCTPPPPSRAPYQYSPQHPGVNPAGQGEKGVTPCRCRCSASKAGRRRPHRSLYTASPARDARRSRAAKPAVRRWGGRRGPNTAAAWRPPRVHCYPGRAMMARLSTGRRLPPRTRGTWGRRRPRQAWPAAAGGMGSRGLTGPRGPASRPAAQTAADRPRPAVPRRRQSTAPNG